MEQRQVKDFSAMDWMLHIGEHKYVVVQPFPIPTSPNNLDKPFSFRVIVHTDGEKAFRDGMNKHTKQFEFHTEIGHGYMMGFQRLKATYCGSIQSATPSGYTSEGMLAYDVVICPEYGSAVWTKEITEIITEDAGAYPYKPLWEID